MLKADKCKSTEWELVERLSVKGQGYFSFSALNFDKYNYKVVAPVMKCSGADVGLVFNSDWSHVYYSSGLQWHIPSNSQSPQFSGFRKIGTDNLLLGSAHDSVSTLEAKLTRAKSTSNDRIAVSSSTFSVGSEDTTYGRQTYGFWGNTTDYSNVSATFVLSLNASFTVCEVMLYRQLRVVEA